MVVIYFKSVMLFCLAYLSCLLNNIIREFIVAAFVVYFAFQSYIRIRFVMYNISVVKLECVLLQLYSFVLINITGSWERFSSLLVYAYICYLHNVI